MRPKSAAIFIIVFLCNTLLFAQTQNEIFERETPITWLGLDFSGAVFIGDSEKFSNDETVYNLMKSLNALMIDESEKYHIPKTFYKDNVEKALQITEQQNSMLKASALRAEKPHSFSPKFIQEIISRYDFKGKTGIGLMFNVENFSKPDGKGVVWITFLDMKTKKVLMTERMIDEPGGFGLRNYWAGCIYGILKQIQRTEYSTWKRKYYHA